MVFIARVFSFITHPLFLPLYVLIFWLILNPYAFGYPSITSAYLLLFYTTITTILIPGIATLMMKTLGFIKDIELKDKQDRIGPLIVLGTFLLWYYLSIQKNTDIPIYFNTYLLGCLITIFLVFVFNLFIKISMHTAGFGLTCVYFVLMVFKGQDVVVLKQEYLFQMALILIILSGLVGALRIFLKSHSLTEIYLGYCFGIFAGILAYFIWY